MYVEESLSIIRGAPTPFEDDLMGFLVFGLHWIIASIEHMFAYVKNIFEHTFASLVEIFSFGMLYDHVADIFTGYMLPVIASYILYSLY